MTMLEILAKLTGKRTAAKPEIPRDMVKMEALMNYIRHQEWMNRTRHN